MREDTGPPTDLLDGLSEQIPETDTIRQLRESARELVDLESRIAAQEQVLSALGDRRNEIANRVLPDLFSRCMVDRIGVPELNADVRMEMSYFANIAGDWPEEQRERGFAELERLGGETMIRVLVSVPYDKGEFEQAMALVEHLREWNEFGNRHISVTKTVHWKTLTSFLKAEMSRDNPPKIDLEPLGARIIPYAKVVARTTKKGR